MDSRNGNEVEDPVTSGRRSSSDGPAPGVIERAFAILNCFTSDTPSLTLTDIMRRTGYAASTTSRLLGDLIAVQALRRDRHKRYSIGPRLMEIAQFVRPMLSVREAASPFLDDLAQVTRLQVQLAALDDDEMTILDRRTGKQKLPVYYHIGDRMPLVPTAAGRMLLAYAGPDVIDRVLDGGRFVWPVFDTPRPPLAEVEESLERIRRTQSVILDVPGSPVHSVAAPVFSRTKAVVAAVGVLVKPGTVPLDRLLPVVRATAMGVTRQLAGPQAQRELPPWDAGR